MPLSARYRRLASSAIWLGPPRFETKTASCTLEYWEHAVLVDATGGAVTITLPSVTGKLETDYVIKKIDASANAVTVSAGTTTIDGSSTHALSSQWDVVHLICDGTEWYAI